jgi:hypothetical protein
MVSLPRIPLSYGALSRHRFHQGASLCWSSGLENSTRVAVAALPRHWDAATLRNYPRMYSVYIRLRSCAPQFPTSGGTHLLRRVTSRVNCQKWTRCHGSPGLVQVDAPASASSSHQHKNTTFNNSTSPCPGKSQLDNIPMMTEITSSYPKI